MSELLLINPRRRKAKAKKAKGRRRASRRHVAVAAAPAPSKRRRRRKMRSFRIKARRNPIAMPKGLMETQIKPAAVGAAGALANDLVIGFLVGKLPVSLRTGVMLQAVKAASAIGVGMLAENVVGRGMARQAAIGALTCVAHDIGRAGLQKMLPASMQLGEQFYAPGLGEQFYAPGLGEQFYAPNLGEFQYHAVPDYSAQVSRLNGLFDSRGPELARTAGNLF